MNDEKIIAVDINITYGFVVAIVIGFLTLSLFGYLALGHEKAAASNSKNSIANSASLRQYYLTKDDYLAENTSSACEDGYHFASLWEIFDPSNLKYNTELGYTKNDSGMGPPSRTIGWIRTGYDSDNIDTPGIANCNNWSPSSSGRGTYAGLAYQWETGGELGPWDFHTMNCSWLRVWCVED